MYGTLLTLGTIIIVLQFWPSFGAMWDAVKTHFCHCGATSKYIGRKVLKNRVLKRLGVEFWGMHKDPL